MEPDTQTCPYDVTVTISSRKAGQIVEETRVLRHVTHGPLTALIRTNTTLEQEYGVANPNIVGWDVIRLEKVAGGIDA